MKKKTKIITSALGASALGVGLSVAVIAQSCTSTVNAPDATRRAEIYREAITGLIANTTFPPTTSENQVVLFNLFQTAVRTLESNTETVTITNISITNPTENINVTGSTITIISGSLNILLTNTPTGDESVSNLTSDVIIENLSVNSDSVITTETNTRVSGITTITQEELIIIQAMTVLSDYTADVVLENTNAIEIVRALETRVNQGSIQSITFGNPDVSGGLVSVISVNNNGVLTYTLSIGLETPIDASDNDFSVITSNSGSPSVWTNTNNQPLTITGITIANNTITVPSDAANFNNQTGASTFAENTIATAGLTSIYGLRAATSAPVDTGLLAAWNAIETAISNSVGVSSTLNTITISGIDNGVIGRGILINDDGSIITLDTSLLTIQYTPDNLAQQTFGPIANSTIELSSIVYSGSNEIDSLLVPAATFPLLVSGAIVGAINALNGAGSTAPSGDPGALYTFFQQEITNVDTNSVIDAIVINNSSSITATNQGLTVTLVIPQNSVVITTINGNNATYSNSTSIFTLELTFENGTISNSTITIITGSLIGS